MKINASKCIGCSACIAECPSNAIILKDFKAVITDKCKDCGKCKNVCPVEAIS